MDVSRFPDFGQKPGQTGKSLMIAEPVACPQACAGKERPQGTAGKGDAPVRIQDQDALVGMIDELSQRLGQIIALGLG